MCIKRVSRVAVSGLCAHCVPVLGALDSSDTTTVKEVKMQLAEIFELTGDLRKALDLVYQGEIVSFLQHAARSNQLAVIDTRKSRGGKSAGAAADTTDAVATESNSLFVEGTSKKSTKTGPRLNAAQLEEAARRKQSEVDEAWRKLGELSAEIQRGVSGAEVKWLIEAELLIEMFRTAKELFTTSTKVILRYIAASDVDLQKVGRSTDVLAQARKAA